MKKLAFFLLLLVAPSAFACELYVGIGKTFRYSEFTTGSSTHVSCVTGEGKYAFTLNYFANQKAYSGTLDVPDYLMLTAERRFYWRKVFLGMGAGAKEDQDCNDVGGEIDYDCNRLVPTALVYVATLGLDLGDKFRLVLGHASNGGMSDPNTGQEWLRFEVRVK